MTYGNVAPALFNSAPRVLSAPWSPKVAGAAKSRVLLRSVGNSLQSLMNWMLRFHVGNPRKLHHLQRRQVKWRHRCLRSHTRVAAKKKKNLNRNGTVSFRGCCEVMRVVSLTYYKKNTVTAPLYPQRSLVATSTVLCVNVHNRQNFT